MAAYHFRLIDKHGDRIGVHFLILTSDDDARRQAETMIGEYDCERVEVWLDDKLICAPIRQLS
jgi:hypothetical protein